MQQRVSDEQPFGEEMSALSQFITEQLRGFKGEKIEDLSSRVSAVLKTKTPAQIRNNQWQTSEEDQDIANLLATFYEHGGSLKLPPAVVTILIKRALSDENINAKA